MNSSKISLHSFALSTKDICMKRLPLVRLVLLAISITGISLLHYLTPLHHPVLHDIFQRLYYIPIIFSAFWFGMRGGLFASILVSVLYAPHILFQWGIGPSLEMEKFLEILLYNVVGGITGFLSEKEEERRSQLERTARGLEESYRKLQSQADMIIGIEEQLRRAERLSALGEMSAVLAHEIRNPLGSIRGTAEILKDAFSPGDRKYEFLEILLKETERLNRVVEDFLHLARPVRADQETCDLVKEIGEVVTLTSGEASASGISLAFLPGEIPPVRGDREKLRQVFFNLILNGIQATAKGGSITVALRHQPAGEENPAMVEIAFADTGKGMTPAVMEKMFAPFFSTREGGTGLGLSIVQKIVESQGGSVQVTSVPGVGTTFLVKLPV